MKGKFLFVLMVLVLIAVAACAPTPTPVPTPAPPTAAPTTAPTTAPPTAAATTAPSGPTATRPPAPTATPPQPGITAAPGALKIQFWHVFGTTQGVAMQKLADKFNIANPSIFIVPTNQGSYTPLHQKMTAAITANSVPDLVWGFPGDLADYYNAGALVPLDSYINDPKDGLSAAQLAEINTSLYFGKYDGKTIAISAAGSEQVMYYNADMLKAAGFDKPPETWDDFDKVCAAVSKPPDVYCYAFVPSASTFAAFVWSRGGDYASADEKKAAFDGPAGVETLKWLKNLVDKKYAYQPSGSFGDQTDFGNGRVAFTFGSTAGLPFYSDAVSGSKNPFKWSIAPFPRGANGKQVVDFFQPSMSIMKTTPEKQRAAWLWIKFMLSREGGTDWALATTYFPPAKSTLDALNAMDVATARQANPNFAKVLDQYKLATKFATLGRVEPTAPAWQGVRAIVDNMTTAVFTAKSGPDFKATDPEAAAKEGAQRVNDALAQYGK